MARKPKPARSIEASAAAVEPELPMLDGAPAPARRGRPPRSAQIPAPSPMAEDSSGAALGIADAGDAMAADAEAGASDRPSKKHQGRKPKSSGSTAAASLSRDEPRLAKGKRGHKPDDAEPAAEPQDAVLSAGAADEDELAAGGDQNAAEVKQADEAATSLAVSGPTASSKPAAQWDRATDTVQFDWPEIKRTASQDGPNQVMAKLLVAARAEGAHSRWPL